ncbi:MAG: ankyrin repeat domain-containing protein, partial [Planctomycetaceae bacterium]|nr:ankyrin repeat domain-containing protein [Planctomycetaceae bacterium]
LRFVLKMFGDEFVHRILNDVRGVNDGRHQNPFLTRRVQKTPQYNSAAKQHSLSHFYVLQKFSYKARVWFKNLRASGSTPSADVLQIEIFDVRKQQSGRGAESTRNSPVPSQTPFDRFLAENAGEFGPGGRGTDQGGRTLLFIAAGDGNLDFVQKLVSNGADVNKKDTS